MSKHVAVDSRSHEGKEVRHVMPVLLLAPVCVRRLVADGAGPSV